MDDPEGRHAPHRGGKVDVVDPDLSAAHAPLDLGAQPHEPRGGAPREPLVQRGGRRQGVEDPGEAVRVLQAPVGSGVADVCQLLERPGRGAAATAASSSSLARSLGASKSRRRSAKEQWIVVVIASRESASPGLGGLVMTPAS